MPLVGTIRGVSRQEAILFIGGFFQALESLFYGPLRCFEAGCNDPINIGVKILGILAPERVKERLPFFVLVFFGLYVSLPPSFDYPISYVKRPLDVELEISGTKGLHQIDRAPSCCRSIRAL